MSYTGFGGHFGGAVARIAVYRGRFRVGAWLRWMAFGLLLSGCADGIRPERTKDDTAFLPMMRWDHRPEAAEWTTASLAAVAGHDDVLANKVPQDIGTWCPRYPTAGLAERRAFWVGLLSATAKHESTWNPNAAGGGGRWIGLMQISPKTARAYGCEAQTTAALKNGTANLACAIRIVSKQVGRDGVVAGEGNRGIGRDWGPFRNAAKRADIVEWTRSQPYCQG